MTGADRATDLRHASDLPGTPGLIRLGKTREIAREKTVTLNIAGTRVRLTCTPEHLAELALGYAVSEGLVSGPAKAVVSGVTVKVVGTLTEDARCPLSFELSSSGTPRLRQTGQVIKAVSPGEVFTLRECRDSLRLLDIDEYKRTRAYHSAALVGKHGLACQSYDVGRHNAVDKAIGLGLKAGVQFNAHFLLVSGRISEGMVTKCLRSGIPLIVSRAAILDSAIRKCRETGLAAVSFMSNVAVKGPALSG
jgi:FdhD protein